MSAHLVSKEMLPWELRPVAVGQKLLTVVTFGQPAPQGSKKGFAIKRNGVYTGRVAMVESSATGVKSWRTSVVEATRPLIMCDCGDPRCVTKLPDFPIMGAVAARMVFTQLRPKSHFRTGRNAHLLREGAPERPTGKPDGSKLLRATEDALTDAGAWADDAKVVDYSRLSKVYAGEDDEALDVPGVVITLYRAVSGKRPEVVRTPDRTADAVPLF